MNNNYGKRRVSAVASLLIASAMIFTAVPAYADGYSESNEYTGTITVKNVEDDATVKAYRMVKATYANGNVTGYQQVDVDLNNDKISSHTGNDQFIADTQDYKITKDELTKIANKIQANDNLLGEPYTLSGGSSGYTAEVPAGEYLILVEKTGTATVYNPAVVSVTYDETPPGGTVDFTQHFNNESTAYLKSSTPTFDKTITDKDEKQVKGDTVAYGDTVNFTLDSMKIPSYSDDYWWSDSEGNEHTPKFNITDELEPEMFKNMSTPTVYVNNQEVESTDSSGNVIYTLTRKDGETPFNTKDTDLHDFKIVFNPDFIKVHGNEDVKVTYTAVVKDDAGTNFDENWNYSTLQYSTNPTIEDGGKTIDSKTYHYTFSIDGNINGTETGTHNTYEFNKVGQLTGTHTIVDEKYGVSEYALQGAEFTLYNDKSCENPYQRNEAAYTAVSDEYGHMKFAGLDAGTYYIKETKAPNGYQLNDHTFQVDIDAVLYEKGNTEGCPEGSLKSYTITITDIGSKINDATDDGEPHTSTYSVTSYKLNTDGTGANAAITPASEKDVRKILPKKMRIQFMMAFLKKSAR